MLLGRSSQFASRTQLNMINKQDVGLCMRGICMRRLATSRLANMFGNGTMYGHDKNLKRAKTPEINQIRTRTGRNRAKDFAKV